MTTLFAVKKIAQWACDCRSHLCARGPYDAALAGRFSGVRTAGADSENVEAFLPGARLAPLFAMRSRKSTTTDVARTRRQHRTEKASALPARRPKVAKKSGRRMQPTAHVRVIGGTLGDKDREYVRQKLGTKLGRLGRSIERISVRVSDVNGPRGGVDQRCRIKVVLSGLPSVVAEGRHASVRPAIDSAIGRATEGVRRSLRRRRMKPLRGRRSAAA